MGVEGDQVSRRQTTSGSHAGAHGGVAPGDTHLLDSLPAPAFLVAFDGTDSFEFVYVNAAFEALLGDADDVLGELRLVLPANALVPHVRAFARAVREQRPISFEAGWGSAESGRTIAVEVTPLFDEDGSCRHLIGGAHEVTQRRRLESELEHRTRHDPITELPNRVMLLEWLHDAIATATDGQSIGLVLLDLDHFKIVNDSLGYEAGDQLLALVAQRVDRVLRAGDRLARLGGDELAIVCHRAKCLEDVVTLAQRVESAFADPFVLDSEEVFLGASVGVVASKGAQDTPARMLRDADIAMFSAKELGRGRVEVFDDSMRERTVRRLEIEGALRRGIVRNEFRVFYQPLVQFTRSEVIGFEALVRWQHPEHGLMPPDEFLTIAEQTGLIVPVGAWVVEEACAQAARWAAESHNRQPLQVAVNLSARQLLDPDLVSIVEGALAASRLDPSLLLVEISEAALIEHREQVVTVLHELVRLGVRIGIDDFGTGHSSLSYLKLLPVDTLKIDSSFVNGLGKDAEDSAIVAAIITLGHAIGLNVMAEGIETQTQLQELRDLGCDLGQGYYFAKPQPGEIVRALVHHEFRWSQRASA